MRVIATEVTEAQVALFWAKVDKHGSDVLRHPSTSFDRLGMRGSGCEAQDDKCWIWTAAVSNQGTPTLQWRGKNTTALRVAWELDRGEVAPKGRMVGRICEDRLCVIPAHLYVLGDSSVVKRMPAGSRLADATAEMLVRFWGKIDKRAPNECWIWAGCCSPAPSIKWGDRLVSALHIVYELERGEAVPEGTQTRRTCGKERCINPAHFKLFGGGQDAHQYDERDNGRSDIFELAWSVGFDLIPGTSPGRYRVARL